jgi:hypothetical protein
MDLRYQAWPEDDGEDVEFRLIYKGELPAQGAGTGGSRIKEKHAIRKQLHGQLRELWRVDQFLSRYMQEIPRRNIEPTADESEKTKIVEVISRNFTKFGYRFVPLISEHFGIACSLDILFLRRDGPGNLIVSGGDIDNRIKVLFDGLRVPKYNEEVAGVPPEVGEDPFYCLLEDDTLITDVRITTDRLLTPQEKEEHIHQVQLVIHVKTKIVDIHRGFSVFA